MATTSAGGLTTCSGGVLLVCIEGISAGGKHTQSTMLKADLESAGYGVVLLSYPDYSSYYGRHIKSFLDGEIKLDVKEQFLIYMIDMVKDLPTVLQALQDGKFIITDRYWPSTLAYQATGGLDYEAAKQMELLIGMPKPAILFYIDTPTGVVDERKQKQNAKLDIFERDIPRLELIRRGFNRVMSDESLSLNCVRIDGRLTIEAIHATIKREVDNLVEKRLIELHRVDTGSEQQEQKIRSMCTGMQT